MLYSITYRPRDFTEIQRPIFLKYIDKISDRYVCSMEKGSGEEYNHFQCFIDTTKRKDNVKRGIFNVIKKVYEFEEDEKKVCLVIKKCSNEKYVIGYCLKECGVIYKGNLEEDYLKLCKEYYDNVAVKKDSVKKLTKNNIHLYFKRYCELKKIEFERWDEEEVSKVIGLMGNENYGMCWLGS
jgi:hypothetical protein